MFEGHRSEILKKYWSEILKIYIDLKYWRNIEGQRNEADGQVKGCDGHHIYDDQSDQWDFHDRSESHWSVRDRTMLTEVRCFNDFDLFRELRKDPNSCCVDLLAVTLCHCPSSVQSFVIYLAESNMWPSNWRKGNHSSWKYELLPSSIATSRWVQKWPLLSCTGLVPLQEKMHTAYFVNLDSDNKHSKRYILNYTIFTLKMCCAHHSKGKTVKNLMHTIFTWQNCLCPLPHSLCFKYLCWLCVHCSKYFLGGDEMRCSQFTFSSAQLLAMAIQDAPADIH